MAYSFQPLDQALESLGFSYVDGVEVKVASKYCLDCDLSQVESLLAAPAPSVLSFDSNYDTSLEKQVLADIDKRTKDEELRKLERQKRIEQYEREKAEELSRRQREAEEKALEDERKRLQEIEDEKKARLAEEQRLLEESAQRKKQEDEEEWRRFEEERLEESRRESESCEKSEDDSMAAEFQTPPQEPEIPGQELAKPNQIVVKGTPANPQNQKFNPQNINFSDFEAISDPFADLELKSINDLAELQTILSHNNYSKPAPGPAHVPTSTAFTGQQQGRGGAGGAGGAGAGAGAGGQANNYYSQTPSQALASRLAQTRPNYNQNFVNYQNYNQMGAPGGGGGAVYYCPPYSHSQYSAQVPPPALPPAPRSLSSDRRTEKLKDSSQDSGSEELKPSRSLGDMITELQKEAEEHQQQKRKSPGSRPGSRGPTGLENWTPWPQLDPQLGGETLTNGGQQVTEDTSCLADLSAEAAGLCEQLREMGFPLTRLATGCRAVGPDSQKLINFCLVVDR